MSDGSALSTKGLVAGGTVEQEAAAVAPPTTEPPQLETSAATGSVVVVIPTSTNIVLLAAENITANLLAQKKSSIALPSLYKRAFLIARETDEIAVVKS